MKNLSKLFVCSFIFLASCKSAKQSSSTKGEVNAASPFAGAKLQIIGNESSVGAAVPAATTTSSSTSTASQKKASAAAEAARAASNAAKAQLLAQQQADANTSAQTVESKAAADKAAAEAAAAQAAAQKAADALEAARKAEEEQSAVINARPGEERLLDFVLDDQCLIDRKKEKDSGVHTPEYFVDKHLTSGFYSKEIGEFKESALTLPIFKGVTTQELLGLADADNCIVGISEHKEGTSLASSTDYDGAENDYREHLQADAADSYFSKAKSTHVKVAVIDTGADYNNPDLEPALSKIEGLSVLEKGNYQEALSTRPQDTHGHGTQMASVIAALGKNGVKGLGAEAGIEVIPIRVENIEKGIKDKKPNERLGSIMLFNTIKRAVNSGADVINLSLSGFYNFNKDVPKDIIAQQKMLLCDPMIGYAIYRAIERGVFVVMAAGHEGQVKWNGEKAEYFPGSVEENLDNKYWDSELAVTPACWGKYFKGAVAVGALDQTNTQIASFSNWGAKSIEMLAPGEGIKSYTINNQIKVGKGTSYSTALVSAAAAMTIAVHKKNGWKYSPWLIEDVLLNGTPQVPELATGDRSIFKGRSLNLKVLADYLKSLEGKTAEERALEPTENPEEGLEVKISSANGVSDSLKRLEVYTKNIFASNRHRIQLQAVAHYSSGSYKVVTPSVQWSSSDTTKLKIVGGVAYPAEKATGLVSVTGVLNGITASTPIALFDGDVVTGTRDFEKIVGLEVTFDNYQPNKTFKNGDTLELLPEYFLKGSYYATSSYVSVYAVYNTGLKRMISREASQFKSDDGLRVDLGLDRFFFTPQRTLYGGSTHEIGFLYKGISTKVKVQVPKWELKPEPITWTISSSYASGKKNNFTKADVYVQSDYLSHFMFEESCELLNEKNQSTKVDRCAASNVYLKNLSPGNYRFRANVSHRGSGGDLKRVYTSHEFSVIDNKPVRAEFILPLKVCPLGSTYMRTIAHIWEDGSRYESSERISLSIKQIGATPFKNSGGDFQYLYIGDELRGKRITVEGVDPRYPDLVATFDCDVEDSSRLAPKEMADLKRPLEKATYPSSQKANIPECANAQELMGEGVPDDPFLVCSFEDLREIMQKDNSTLYSKLMVEHDGYNIWQEGVFVQLGANIDLSHLTPDDLPIKASGNTLGNQSSLIHLDGNDYEMFGLTLADKEKDFSFFGDTRLKILKNLRFKNFAIAARAIKPINAVEVNRVAIKDLVIQSETDVILFNASEAMESLLFSDVSVVMNSGMLNLIYANEIKKSSFSGIRASCAVKYNCSANLFRAQSTIQENGVWDLEASFFSYIAIVFSDKTLANTFDQVKVRANQSIIVNTSAASPHNSPVGVGFFTEREKPQGDKYYPNGIGEGIAPKKLLANIVYKNYINADLEGEASVGTVSGESYSSFVQENYIKGTFKSNRCAGAVFGELNTFTRMVSNRIEATAVTPNPDGSAGTLIGCLNTHNFDLREQYLSPVSVGNIVSGPMVGKVLSTGAKLVDLPQDGSPYLFE
ncbi:MAG: S8 family serine peptidase [Bdellovibrionota bacterium]